MAFIAPFLALLANPCITAALLPVESTMIPDEYRSLVFNLRAIVPPMVSLGWAIAASVLVAKRRQRGLPAALTAVSLSLLEIGLGWLLMIAPWF